MPQHTLSCISPIDSSVYATRTLMTPHEVMQKIKKARSAQKLWQQVPLHERISLVLKAIDLLGSHTERMTQELAHQMGRPIRYGGEFSGVHERSHIMAKLAPKALATSLIEESDLVIRKIEREPLGVILTIAPWNYPYMTAINTIVPALIAGNAVFLKHASQTLLVGEHLAEVFHQSGINPDLFQNLFLSHTSTQELIKARAFDFISFTGSTRAGASIETQAAGSFVGVATELGGKDPAYVRHDADPLLSADSLIDGAMFNSGQCCCAIERIYVHEDLFDPFLERAIAIVDQYVLGNPLHPNTTLGPMAHERFAHTVRSHIQDALKKGATPHVTSFPQDNNAAYLSPQILTHVDHSMTIMREETFGPVVGIMKVRNDTEAIQLMNDSSFGLTASLWSEDTNAVLAIGQQLETGTVFMNRCDHLDPALCWSGRKNTGRGNSLSTLGFLALTQPKSYHLKRTAS